MKSSNVLTGEELAKLTECVNVGKCAVYSRLMLSGVLYSSAQYNRSGITNDSIISLTQYGKTMIGTTQKFVSCCNNDCVSCTASTYCSHFVVVATHPTFPFGITDEATNSTAQHVMQIGKSM